VERRKYLN